MAKKKDKPKTVELTCPFTDVALIRSVDKPIDIDAFRRALSNDTNWTYNGYRVQPEIVQGDDGVDYHVIVVRAADEGVDSEVWVRKA